MASGRFIDYLGYGEIAERPAAPDLFAGALGLYYNTDSDPATLSVWADEEWFDIPLTSAVAAGISVTPAGNITVTDVQAALEELDGFIAALAIPESIGDLEDVDITTTPPVDGDVLVWDTDKFVPAEPSGGARIISSNLLSNPGFELGAITGWTAYAGFTIPVVATLSNGNATATPRSGTYLCYAAAQLRSAAYQDVSVSAFATEIDAEECDYDASIWYSNDDTAAESAQLHVQFLDGSSNVIGGDSKDLCQPWPRYLWQQYRLQGIIPPNTRTIRFIIMFVRSSGTNNNISADDCVLRIIQQG